MGILFDYNDGEIIGNYWKIKEVFIREENKLSHVIISLYPHKDALLSGVQPIFTKRIMWCNNDFFLTDELLNNMSANSAIYNHLINTDMIGGLVDMV